MTDFLRACPSKRGTTRKSNATCGSYTWKVMGVAAWRTWEKSNLLSHLCTQSVLLALVVSYKKCWSVRIILFFSVIFLCHADKIENGDVYQRRRGPHSGSTNGQETGSKQQEEVGRTGSSWRRILLLILAITIHNIPGQNQPQGCLQ